MRTQRQEEAQAALRDLAVQELELAERRSSLIARIDGLELRAPVAGIVHDLQVTTPRAVIRPAEPVLSLIPLDRPLVIAARVHPNDIDQVRVGQAATLVFPAFGMRDMPDIAGRVTRVSADAFADDRTGLRYYRVELLLDEEGLAALAGRDLIPGMPVDAFIRTRSRSPFEYLAEPLMVYFNRAFREG